MICRLYLVLDKIFFEFNNLEKFIRQFVVIFRLKLLRMIIFFVDFFILKQVGVDKYLLIL